jgi:hypothetical protein
VAGAESADASPGARGEHPSLMLRPGSWPRSSFTLWGRPRRGRLKDPAGLYPNPSP